MPTYAQLNQRHPSVDPAEQAELSALYTGGKEFDARLAKFLPQRPHEASERYATRCKEAHYRNYIGPAIDYFTAMLFSSRPATVAKRKGEPVNAPGDYYDKLRDDCDRNGQNVDALFKGRLTEAMVGGCSWLRVHQPQAGDAPVASQADFEALKLGECWLEALDSCRVLDWETNDSGTLEWAIVHRCSARRAGLAGSRDTITETWDYLTAADVTTFALTYDRTKPPDPTKTEVPQVGQVPHRFGRVPLVCLELPVGLWVANRLRSPQLSHFRLSCAQTWGMSTACYAMPVFKLTEDSEGNFRMPKMGAGYGIFIGKDDDFDWAAPPATPFAALGEEIKAEKDEIFRIAQQMAIGVDNNSAAIGRSGESKKADIEATRVVLLAFSRVVKETIEYTYDLISAARGDDLEWSVQGLDDFAALDVGGLAETLAQVQDIGGIPSKTWNIAVKSRIAEAILPDMDQGEKQKVRQEIQANEPDPADAPSEEEKLHALAAKMTGLPPNGDQNPSGNRSRGGEKPPGAPGGGNGGARPPGQPS